MRIILIIYISILTCISIKSQSNSALVLNGCTDVIEFPDNNHVDFDEAITITALIRPNCGDGNRVFLSKELCSGQYGYYMSVIDQKLRWSYSFDGFCDDSFAVTSFDNVIPADQYSHVAVVHTLFNISLFVNGIEVSTDYSQWAGGRKIHDSSEPLRLGAYQNISQVFTNYYSGLIDDVTIWNKELTESEIKNLISNAPNTNDSNLMFYLDMEGSGVGDQLMLQNLATNASIGNGNVVGSNSNSPYTANGNSYSNVDFNIGVDTTVCTLPLTLSVDPGTYKSISWNTGETTFQIDVNNPDTYVATVEAEACRFLSDEILINLDTPDTIANTINLCQGDSIAIDGLIITQPGTYLTYSISTNGCTVVTENAVTVTQQIQTDILLEICNNESAEINGIFYNQAGRYTQTLVGSSDCDSTLNITITTIESKFSSVNQQICDGKTFNFNGTNYNMPGSYDTTFVGANGCDSIVTLELSIFPNMDRTESYTFCTDDGLTVNQETYTSAGTYTQQLADLNGCEGLLTLILDSEDCSSCGSSANAFGAEIDITKKADGTFDILISKQNKTLFNDTVKEVNINEVLAYYGRIQFYNTKPLKSLPTAIINKNTIDSIIETNNSEEIYPERKASKFYTNLLSEQIKTLRIGGKMHHR